MSVNIAQGVRGAGGNVAGSGLHRDEERNPTASAAEALGGYIKDKSLNAIYHDCGGPGEGRLGPSRTIAVISTGFGIGVADSSGTVMTLLRRHRAAEGTESFTVNSGHPSSTARCTATFPADYLRPEVFRPC
jgi:hypothetical protein